LRAVSVEKGPWRGTRATVVDGALRTGPGCSQGRQQEKDYDPRTTTHEPGT
jgi:hypothetical protein